MLEETVYRCSEASCQQAETIVACSEKASPRCKLNSRIRRRRVTSTRALLINLEQVSWRAAIILIDIALRPETWNWAPRRTHFIFSRQITVNNYDLIHGRWSSNYYKSPVAINHHKLIKPDNWHPVSKGRATPISDRSLFILQKRNYCSYRRTWTISICYIFLEVRNERRS